MPSKVSTATAYGNIPKEICSRVCDLTNNGARVWVRIFEAVEDSLRVTSNWSLLEPSSSLENGSLPKRKKKMAGSNRVCDEKIIEVRFSKIKADVST